MPPEFRLIVTGSRTWNDWEAVSGALTAVALEARSSGCTGLVVVEGACPDGADKWARQWVTAHRGDFPGLEVTTEEHPAKWRRSNGRLDRSAGFRRNEEMVALGADLCLAFGQPCARESCRTRAPHMSHGTSHCARLAETAGIRTRRITDG